MPAMIASLFVSLFVTPMADVAGTYDTSVSVLESTCQMNVESNPTEVQHVSPTTITLRHAGTTYVGTLAADLSFRTEPKLLDFAGVQYRITIEGQFTSSTMDARVTLEYGQPACRVVVRWQGPKRA